MEWKTHRLCGPIKAGDVVGCGWLRGEESGGKGTVYFTLNGERFESVFTDVPGELYPFLYIQKKVRIDRPCSCSDSHHYLFPQSTRVQVNFGTRVFMYSEGRAHREAADLVEQEESCEEIVALFAVLPFANDWESDEEEEEQKGEGLVDEGVVMELSQTGPPTRKLKPPIVTIGMDSLTRCPSVK